MSVLFFRKASAVIIMTGWAASGGLLVHSHVVSGLEVAEIATGAVCEVVHALDVAAATLGPDAADQLARLGRLMDLKPDVASERMCQLLHNF